MQFHLAGERIGSARRVTILEAYQAAPAFLAWNLSKGRRFVSRDVA
jgi:hypothetical protein